MELSIQRETSEMFREVEELTRDAFWNLYVMGCNEHYLTHVMRSHPDFIPELDLVGLIDQKVVANIMYTKCSLADDKNHTLKAATFGPVCVLPEFQKQGIGSALIRYSLKLARELGYQVVIIQGDPHNYCKHGFKNSKDLKISDADGKYPYSLLALELHQDVLANHQWLYQSSDVYNMDEKAAEEFDKSFPPKKKEYRPSQDEFFIACRAYLL